ncbi:uncharacterized protein N7525_007049 [Penicillium rubens]|uniref:uncharacterized protein n=1 Tax=Penicillium rubens TaxID=1108849 RepID=UPI002A5A4B17|nr:uncharacterized protein N7525_007049 [Penicillium rubens]KAJ5828796.1 hypothetical protein N7525_007049 [Penicillium rubens]
MSAQTAENNFTRGKTQPGAHELVIPCSYPGHWEALTRLTDDSSMCHVVWGPPSRPSDHLAQESIHRISTVAEQCCEGLTERGKD